MHVDMWWRIRPYSTAEPFWTVAVEFWLYVAAGLFFLCVLLVERIRRSHFWILTALNVPVLLWNTVAGGGGSLSLVRMVGALAAYLLARIEIADTQVRWRILPGCPIGYGAVALDARAETAGFDPYNPQITKNVLDVWSRVVAARGAER